MAGPKVGFNLTNEAKKIVNDPSVQAWLNEFANQTTREQYRARIHKFFVTINKSPEDLQSMTTKEVKQLILDFQRTYKQTTQKRPNGADYKPSNNQVLAIITAVRSYLVSLEKEVSFRKNQLVNGQEDTHSHVFTNADLKKLFDVGGAFEKALLATAVSEGWEISAFLEQSRSKVLKRLAHAVQNGEKYIFFNEEREKTGEPRFCVLNPLAIECLTHYLSIRTDDVGDDRLFPITQDGVQKMLYRLAKDADLKTTGTLRFHNIRKWLMSRLSRCSFNEFQIKYIMGKSIGLSDSTYLQTLRTEIEEKYPIVYNEFLCLCPKLMGGQVFSSEEIAQLKALLAAAKDGKITWNP